MHSVKTAQALAGKPKKWVGLYLKLTHADVTSREDVIHEYEQGTLADDTHTSMQLMYEYDRVESDEDGSEDITYEYEWVADSQEEALKDRREQDKQPGTEGKSI